jgi:hypothetical protein
MVDSVRNVFAVFSLRHLLRGTGIVIHIMPGKRIAFLENKLTLRGTSIALYDYAHYNEKLLGNTSFIITRNYDDVQHSIDVDKQAYDKFIQRFPMIYYKEPSDLDALIEKNSIDILFIEKSGQASDELMTSKCKSIVHCVFETHDPHGSIYCGLSQWLNERNSTNIPVLPYMVDVRENNITLRESLGIPQGATVFGSYGGSDEILWYVRNAIIDISNNPAYSNIYFLFMNIPSFAENSERLRFLKGTDNMDIKRAFINTCDAMVYGRIWGETFGLACAEFSVCDKPVIGNRSPKDKFHIQTLGDSFIGHDSYEECYTILTEYPRFKKDVSKNNYKKYTPEIVMNTFNSMVQRLCPPMNLAYAFIGPLPSYSVDTVEQARKFFHGPIYFIVSDYQSQYIPILESKYYVNIVRYDSVIDNDFNTLIKETYSKFAIVDRLYGREKLFIYSFERFYILHSLMRQRGLIDVFFLELDNLIYDDPIKWLSSFQKKDMAYMYEQHDRCSSGICYIKNASILQEFMQSSSNYIRTDTGFIHEMGALFHFWESAKDKVQFLPTHWSPEHAVVARSVPVETYENYEVYKTLFDGAGLGIFIGGMDPYHTGGRIEKWKHRPCLYDIDYTKYTYEWRKDEEGRNIPYVFTGVEWIRINNLHIHSKDLRDNM